MTSELLQYYKENTTIGYLDGTYISTPPLHLDNRKTYGIRIISVRLSPMIPNLYNFDGVITNKLDISNDNFVTRQTLVFPSGTYSVQQINTAVIARMNQLGWNTSTLSNESALYIGLTPTSKYMYVRLDSTKLVGGIGQIAIDFSSGGTSNLYEVLGFTSPTSFNIDGLYAAYSLPLIDWQGSNCDIISNTFANATFVNGNPSNVLISFPLWTDSNEILFPNIGTGLISAVLHCDVPYIINRFDISIRNQRTGKSIVFMYGAVNITLEVLVI